MAYVELPNISERAVPLEHETHMERTVLDLQNNM